MFKKIIIVMLFLILTGCNSSKYESLMYYEFYKKEKNEQPLEEDKIAHLVLQNPDIIKPEPMKYPLEFVIDFKRKKDNEKYVDCVPYNAVNIIFDGNRVIILKKVEDIGWSKEDFIRVAVDNGVDFNLRSVSNSKEAHNDYSRVYIDKNLNSDYFISAFIWFLKNEFVFYNPTIIYKSLTYTEMAKIKQMLTYSKPYISEIDKIVEDCAKGLCDDEQYNPKIKIY